MEKIKSYQNILVRYLNQCAEIINNSDLEISREVIADCKSNNFQLLDVGWVRGDYVFVVLMHFKIIDGKIWIQWNRTEHEIVDFLLENGVPRTNIVLGFKPKSVRPHTGFAVA